KMSTLLRLSGIPPHFIKGLQKFFGHQPCCAYLYSYLKRAVENPAPSESPSAGCCDRPRLHMGSQSCSPYRSPTSQVIERLSFSLHLTRKFHATSSPALRDEARRRRRETESSRLDACSP